MIIGIIVAVIFVVLLIILKIAEYRINEKRRRKGLPPVWDEPEIHDVIDWSRRK